jgi:predicted 3-demethylubiquinone-9 3-methyltransferase (glyoxalase superfamily)
MQPFTTCLWFDHQAEEAAKFYVSLFPDSKLGPVTPYPSDMPGGAAGRAMTVEFELNGQKFVGLNGGPVFRFSEACSFQIPCESQAEIDRYWDALTADGGEPGNCGWCKDRFGLSWQVVPRDLPRYLDPKDPARARRVADTFLKMGKLDLAAIEAAAREPADA